MAHVIVGIHGRSPKPPLEEEKGWWRDALLEGLVRNEKRSQDNPIRFELSYYADLFGAPLERENNAEPYQPASGNGPFPTYEEGWLDEVVKKALNVSDWTVEQVDKYYGFDGLLRTVLARTMRDLHEYYTNDAKRADVQQRLIDVLDPLLGNDQVLLIAHSMGTIVAYDVLRRIGRQRPRGTIKHFVTIGAPLGLPHVKLMVQSKYDLARTPSLVERWTNLSDRRDYVALDAHLSDDYAPNSNGVHVFDDLVINGYTSPNTGKANPHKSYGYLRTPELSRLIREFI
ncbi:lipase/acyltransferase domain-containing protein [Azospirillum argentinense]